MHQAVLRVGYLLTGEDQEKDSWIRSQIGELRRQQVEVCTLSLGTIDPDRLNRAVDQVILEAQRRGLTHLHAQFTKFPVSLARLVSRRIGISYSLGVRLSDLRCGGLDLDSLPAIARTARFLVADSEATRRRLREHLPPGQFGRLVRIYGGVNLDTFRPVEQASGLGWSRPPLILALGRLAHANGFDLLIEACALLKDRRVPFRCTIAGSGEQYGRLSGLAERRGVADRVRIIPLPAADCAGDLYRQARVVCLPLRPAEPGRPERLPLCLLEAIACGLPVVSTALEGISEIVLDGANGTLVPPDDVVRLAAALERLLRDRKVSESYGGRSRAHALRNFDLRKSVRLLRLAVSNVAEISRSSLRPLPWLLRRVTSG